ncbi:MAG: hypothetical protein QF437_25655 [Planctomycetota bacterium]|jgi:hypothetical protein|nr:hypothetical protein [Planctomycetota bacterium]
MPFAEPFGHLADSISPIHPDLELNPMLKTAQADPDLIITQLSELVR